MNVEGVPVYGTSLGKNHPAGSSSGPIVIPGRHNGRTSFLKLDKDILSKHMMLIGGTGCGKSNVFYHLLSQIKRNLTSDDVMIVFDTKGDYYSLFSEPGDLVIGNSADFFDRSAKWNIFREILADGWEDRMVELNARELSWSVFRESTTRSKDPFFPNAARDLFSTILLCILKKGKLDGAYKREFFYNSELKRAFDESSIQEVRALIASYPEVSSVLSYIGDGTTAQALGVYAELQGTVRKLFSGAFADKGDFSIRNLVKKKQGKTLFIEYDMSIGDSLAPVYSLLFDLALKEALGRTTPNGSVYLICDEFRLLPFLQHIDDGVNFGRSMGVKVIAGLQSINQLTEAYGEYRGKNILAGFSTIMAFRANDAYTRDYITNLYGKNIVLEQYRTIDNSLREETREARVVEDWDMNKLQVGEAVVGLPFKPPFKFSFNIYQKGKAKP